MVCLLLAWQTSAEAQTTQPRLEQRLATPHQSSLGGGSLRGALDAISESTGVTYWLERRVDPQQGVEVPLAGPTAEAAFEKIAAAAGLVILPIDNLVLVGRAAWVDSTGTLILAALTEAAPAKENGQAGVEVRDVPRQRPVAIHRPLLSSPTEALQVVAEASSLDLQAVRLPHDLWPAFSSDAIRPATLWTLIGCEFDQWLRVADGKQLQSQPIPETVAIDKAYAKSTVEPLRERIEQVDPAAELVENNDRVTVRASVRVHRLLRPRPRVVAPRGRPQPAATSTARFTINWQNAPADKALQTLAQAGGWQLQIDSTAQSNCLRRIHVTVEDMPLVDLIQKVAEQVDVTPTWQDDVLRITPAAP